MFEHSAVPDAERYDDRTGMELDVGRVIAGKYRLVRLLGRGSMGEVWVAHHQSLDEKVAVKILRASPADGELTEPPAVAAARFQQEAQLAARLSRKTRHIVRVTDHGEEDGLAYLVMELLEGETLETRLQRERKLPLPLLASIVSQIARALTQAHGEGVAHRDLKPANVFLTTDEDGGLVVKLLDFGIARAVHAHRVRSPVSTANGLVFGTPSYMSPEQARGSRKLDQRCDLWALATVAYEGASGAMPLDGEETDEIVQNLCAGRIVPLRTRDARLGSTLGGFFDRAFSEHVDARFQSATELAHALAAAVGVPVRASAPSLPDRTEAAPSLPTAPPAPSPGRARLAIVAAATVAVVIGLAAVWRLVSGSHDALPTAAASSETPGASSTTPVPPSSPPAGVAPPQATAPPAIDVTSLPQVVPPPPPSTAAPRGASASASPTPPPASKPATSVTPGRDRSEVF